MTKMMVNSSGGRDQSSTQTTTAITPSFHTYLETLTAGVDGANAEAELAARKRAAKVRRGAMVMIY